jgi:hypothetical protein
MLVTRIGCQQPGYFGRHPDDDEDVRRHHVDRERPPSTLHQLGSERDDPPRADSRHQAGHQGLPSSAETGCPQEWIPP